MVCRWRRAPRAYAALALLLPSTCMPDHLLFLPVSDSLVLSFRRVPVSHFLSVSLSLCLACAYARALLRIQVNSSLPTVDVLAPLIKAIHASLSTSNPGHAASANAAFQVMVCAAITKLRKKTLKHLPEPLHWGMVVRIQCTSAYLCKECLQAPILKSLSSLYAPKG